MNQSQYTHNLKLTLTPPEVKKEIPPTEVIILENRAAKIGLVAERTKIQNEVELIQSELEEAKAREGQIRKKIAAKEKNRLR